MLLYGSTVDNAIIIPVVGDTREDMFKAMNDYLDEIGFKSYYFRSWQDPVEDFTTIDYGSHYNFFFIVKNK